MRAAKEGVWVPIYSLRLWDTARKSFGGHCGNEVGVVFHRRGPHGAAGDEPNPQAQLSGVPNCQRP
jgi:hypothetical protein